MSSFSTMLILIVIDNNDFFMNVYSYDEKQVEMQQL